MAHRDRGIKFVLAPPGGPIQAIYRDGMQQVKIAETEKTMEYVTPLDEIFDKVDGLQTWWANVADVAVQLMDTAVWAKNYMGCEATC